MLCVLTNTSRVVNPRVGLILSMLSTLVSGSSGPVLVRALAGDLVMCSSARKTLYAHSAFVHPNIGV